MIVSNNYGPKKGSVPHRRSVGIRATRRAGITRDTRSEPGISRLGQTTEHLYDAGTNDPGEKPLRRPA